jgi:hypothetical protein
MRPFYLLPAWLGLLALAACSGTDAESPLGAPEPQVQTWPRSEVERDLKLELSRTTSEPFEQGADPKLQVVLRNHSKDRAYSVVMTSDGSEMGWREPHAWFQLAVRHSGEAFHAPPPVQYMRCGNYDEDWQKDIVTLGPGQSRTLPWMQFYFQAEFDTADEVRVTAHYAYGDQAKDLRAVPPALHGMPAYAIESVALVLAIDRPVALKLELHGALPRGPGQPLSSVVSVTATNVSKRAVPFATAAAGGLLQFEVELADAPPGTSPKTLGPADVPAFSETQGQLLPGASHDALDIPAATTADDWELLPDEHVRRIRAVLNVAAHGDSHVAASPWVDVPER